MVANTIDKTKIEQANDCLDPAVPDVDKSKNLLRKSASFILILFLVLLSFYRLIGTMSNVSDNLDVHSMKTCPGFKLKRTFKFIFHRETQDA